MWLWRSAVCKIHASSIKNQLRFRTPLNDTDILNSSMQPYNLIHACVVYIV